MVSPLRIPADPEGTPGGTGEFGYWGANGISLFDLRLRPCVYATRVDSTDMPIHQYSEDWKDKIIHASNDPNTPSYHNPGNVNDTLWRNFSYQNTGYQPYIVGASTPLQTLYCRKPTTRASNGYGTSHPERFAGYVQYPVGDPTADQGNGAGVGPLYLQEISGGLTSAHTDAHVIAFRRDTGELWEIYGYRYGTGPGTQDSDGNPFPNAFMAKYYNIKDRHFVEPLTGATADESGQIIWPMLPRLNDIVNGPVRHVIRFNAPAAALQKFGSGQPGGYVWPARNGATSGAGGYTGDLVAYNKFVPMGAWARLKASYDISGYSTDMQTFLTGLKQYGMILSDIGESWSIVGTANEDWSTLGNAGGFLAEMRTVPVAQLEFIDQSGFNSNGDLTMSGTSTSP